ncbi:MAG: thermonuclease family protein [Candidatus Gracilibacteria bacterium]|nr:thermonuclease family protein [Candidatus Gracilibacteria bacterium]
MKFRNLFLLLGFFVVLISQVFGNLNISEIFPNTDDDANLEYIELYNNSDQVLFLSGYILKDTSEKEFVFDETYFLNVQERKKYFRNETKLLLNNSDEQLFLYDNFGNLLDSYTYATSEKGKVIVIYDYINTTEVLGEADSNTQDTQSGSLDVNEEVLSSTGSLDIDNTQSQTGSVMDSDDNSTETGSIDSTIETETGSIVTENNDTEWINTQSGTVDNNTVSSSGNIVENINNNFILLPEIEYSFQVPTYLLEKEEIVDVYNCDTSKEECKINLDLRNSFVGDFSESDYLCKIDFGFETSEGDKCNPNTIVVPIGTFDFKVQIINKNNLENFIEKSFKVVNKGYIKPVVSSSTVYVSNIYTDNSSLNISKPQIIIQSGINDKNECTNKKSCSINLNYELKNSRERCIWDFGNAIFDSGTQFKCNPGYVKYGNGFFEVKLKVYEYGNENNYNITELNFTNIQVEQKVIEEEIKDEVINEDNKELMYVIPYGNTDVLSDYSGLKLHKLLPNPAGSDDLEFIEIINNGELDLDLSICKLDDIIDGGSKAFKFSTGEIIKKGETKKYLKEVTKINLNNDLDEVNLFCKDLLIDKLARDFKVKDGFYLDHSRLDVFSGKAKVVEVIDGDTVKVQFLSTNKVENMRLIGIDTPETKNPNKEIQEFGQEAYDFVNDTISGLEVDVEMDPNNFRDNYARLLGFVYVDGESFNKKLIELGYAKAYLDYDFKYSEEYKKAESVAKKQNLGIWGLNSSTSVIISSKKVVDKSTSLVSTGSIESIITIQGKIGKNKTITGNSITCFDTCSINFDGSESTGNIQKYSWDFGNGQKFEGKNPKGIKYERFGNYKVYLAVLGDNGELNIGEYIVNFYQTPKKAKKTTIVPKAEASSKEDEDYEKKIEQTEVLDFGSQNSIIIYILIGVFGVLLILMLLRKEKML